MPACSLADVQKASGCESGSVLNWFATLDVKCYFSFFWMASCTLYIHCRSSSVWKLSSQVKRWRWGWDKCQDQEGPGVVFPCKSQPIRLTNVTFLESVGTLGFRFVVTVVTTAVSCLWKLKEWLPASAAASEANLDAAVVILVLC